MRVVLNNGEANMATGAAREGQHRAVDRLGVLPEQQPVAGPIGIGAQRTEQRFIGQPHADAGFHEIAAPRVFARIAQAAPIAFQPVHQPCAVTGLIQAQRGFRLAEPRQRALRC